MAAEQLGYSHAMIAATQLEGPVEEIGRHLARMAMQMRDTGGPNCLISGGEGTVALIGESERGKGGRNQQLVLAALDELVKHDSARGGGIAILSAGTDGEDGPTDAAGAWLDAVTIEESQRLRLDPADFLRRNDAYHFFDPLGALLKTGPTHTNVCDVRVVVVR
jgi:glycerate-2-kinase